MSIFSDEVLRLMHVQRHDTSEAWFRSRCPSSPHLFRPFINLHRCGQHIKIPPAQLYHDGCSRRVGGEAQNQRSESAGSGRSIILSPDEPVSTVNPMPEHRLYHVVILGNDLFDIPPGL